MPVLFKFDILIAARSARCVRNPLRVLFLRRVGLYLRIDVPLVILGLAFCVQNFAARFLYGVSPTRCLSLHVFLLSIIKILIRVCFVTHVQTRFQVLLSSLVPTQRSFSPAKILRPYSRRQSPPRRSARSACSRPANRQIPAPSRRSASWPPFRKFQEESMPPPADR